jgi:mannose-1-phosphate guanylyltransferase
MGQKENFRNPDFARAYAIIMAGGSGTRFWPLSRRNHPKQLLEIFGGATLLEQTVERLQGLVPPERIYIFTNEFVHTAVARLLPQIPKRQIVPEPAQRNTAPTVGLAAQEILRRDPQGVMVILPADHVIIQPGAFRKALKVACRWGSTEGRSVVLGIKPTRPATGYGYVRLGDVEKRVEGQKVFGVERFAEKPKLAAARRYMASGRYLWNAGMFVWRASTLLENLQRYQPKMARDLAQIAAAGGINNRRKLKQLFPRLEKISVDYALMEKISGVFAVGTDMGWSDVGSWTVAYELSPKDKDGNVLPKNSLSIASAGNMVVADRGFLVTIGVENLIIVQTGDALLVCARERSQDVGKAVQELSRLKLNKLL